MKLRILFAALSVVALVGCNEDSDKAANSEQHELDGIWKTACHYTPFPMPKTDSDGFTSLVEGYATTTHGFDTDSFIKTTGFYEDASCSIPVTGTQTMEGTYVVGEEVVTTSGLTARRLAVSDIRPRPELLWDGTADWAYTISNNALYLGNKVDGEFVLNLEHPAYKQE